MPIALVVQIVTAALQLAPLAVGTVKDIKTMLANDQAVPPDLKAILKGTIDDATATQARVAAWLAAHPE